MAIAAVPRYLGQDFSTASPGLRFGMYLRLWGVNRRSQALLWTTHDVDYEVRGQQREEREVRLENKVPALKEALKLETDDQKRCKALASRLAAAAATVPPEALLTIEGRALSPFTTGLGIEHPLENGFAFLNPYGLPYLPGSGVKGVLRQAARELASGEWGGTQGWSTESRYALEINGKTVSMLDLLFGRETAAGYTEHLRGVLSFWDVIPQIKGDKLKVEIMTPHQSHYYQQRLDPRAGNSLTPHDSGQPNPIAFLTVPPGSDFSFHVVCDTARLQRLAPELAEDQRWKALLGAAFEHAFEWLGFGAKTAVGYGAMASPTQRAHRKAEAHAVAAAQAKALGAAAPADAAVKTEVKTEVWPSAELLLDPGSGRLSATYQKQTATGHRDQCRMSEAFKERLKKKKRLSARLTVEKEGNRLVILAAEDPQGGA